MTDMFRLKWKSWSLISSLSSSSLTSIILIQKILSFFTPPFLLYFFGKTNYVSV